MAHMHSADLLTVSPNSGWQVTLEFPSLTLGGVNRACARTERPGGKGSHFAMAANTLKPGSTAVAHCLGGEPGRRVRAALDALRTPQIVGAIAERTRICTTLVNVQKGEATELLEPSPVVTVAEAERFEAAVREAAVRMRGLAFCGTLPEGLPHDFYARVANFAKPDTWVLLDGCRKVEDLLETGQVRILKVNEEELSELCETADLRKAADLCLERWGIEWVGVTAGPEQAWLIGQNDTFSFKIPPVQARNPIGAGDTVAGVMMRFLLDGGAPERAFRYGLAAASASCESLTGAEFSPLRMEVLAANVEVKKQ